MSAVPSSISIVAQLRLQADELRQQIAQARQEFQQGFQTMEIPLGTKLTESVVGAAPKITETIAAAVAAGATQGAAQMQQAMAAVSPQAMFGGVGFSGASARWPMGPPSSLGDSLDEDAAGGSMLGGFGGAGIFSAFMAMRFARSQAEYYAKGADEDEALFRAQGMPGRNDSQRERRSESEIAAYKQQIDRASTWSSYFDAVGSTFTKEGMNASANDIYSRRISALETQKSYAETDLKNAQMNEDRSTIFENQQRLTQDASVGGMTGFARQRQEILNRDISEHDAAKKLNDEHGGSGADLDKAYDAITKRTQELLQQLTDQETSYSKRLDIENEIGAAYARGDKAEAERLEVVKKVADQQESMNKQEAGSGDAWASKWGAMLIQGQQQEHFNQEQRQRDTNTENQQREDEGLRKRATERRAKDEELYRHTQRPQEDYSGELSDDPAKRHQAERSKMQSEGQSRIDDLRANAKSEQDQAKQALMNKEADVEQKDLKARLGASDEQYDRERKKRIGGINEDATETQLRAQGRNADADKARINYDFNQQVQTAGADKEAVAAINKDRQAHLADVDRNASHLDHDEPKFMGHLEAWKHMQNATDLMPKAPPGSHVERHVTSNHPAAGSGLIHGSSPLIHSGNPLIHSTMSGGFRNSGPIPHGVGPASAGAFGGSSAAGLAAFAHMHDKHPTDMHNIHAEALHQVQSTPGWQNRVRQAQEQDNSHHADSKQRTEMAQQKASQDWSRVAERIEKSVLRAVIVQPQ